VAATPVTAELEKLLEDSRRSGKRQAAPFSKGAPTEEPKRPGRASGKNHGKHGHRLAPTAPVDRELDAPLPRCCPDCGGAVVHERDEEQSHTSAAGEGPHRCPSSATSLLASPRPRTTPRRSAGLDMGVRPSRQPPAHDRRKRAGVGRQPG